MIVAIWILFSFAFISVVLRFASRIPFHTGRSSLGWDDWTILILLALEIPVNVTIHRFIHYGFGQDIWMLEEYQIVAIFKVGPLFVIYLGTVLYTELTSVVISITWLT